MLIVLRNIQIKGIEHLVLGQWTPAHARWRDSKIFISLSGAEMQFLASDLKFGIPFEANDVILIGREDAAAT